MIKYPESKPKRESDGTECSLKATVNTGMVALGQRYMIEGRPVTCVDINENKYIFSMDEIFKCTSYRNISPILKRIYETGKIDDKEVLPVSMMKNIDFLFVPCEYQVFGQNCYGDNENTQNIKQFEWYKIGDFVRIKGYRGIKGYLEQGCHWLDGEICPWWLSTICSNNSKKCCFVDKSGCIQCDRVTNTLVGIPIFIQITAEKF